MLSLLNHDNWPYQRLRWCQSAQTDNSLLCTLQCIVSTGRDLFIIVFIYIIYFICLLYSINLFVIFISAIIILKTFSANWFLHFIPMGCARPFVISLFHLLAHFLANNNFLGVVRFCYWLKILERGISWTFVE